jgi:hypothetical protein
MAMNFALILEAVKNSLSVTVDELKNIANAVTIQLNRDVSPVWGGNHIVRVSDGTDLTPDEVAFAIVDSLPDEPGAVAYHDINGVGVPVAFEAIAMCNAAVTGKDSMSVAISHECIETIVDFACNEWVDDGSGSEWAKEACDSVESVYYAITTGIISGSVDVSAFLLPAFFNPNSKGPYSFPSLPMVPFRTYSGGYQIKRASGSSETQVTAEIIGRQRIHSLKRRHMSSRAFRRGLK